MSKLLVIRPVLAYLMLPKWLRVTLAGVAGVIGSGAIVGHY